MLIQQKDLRKVFEKLYEDGEASLALEGFDVKIEVLEQVSKYLISTPVYFGGNFIPISVRNAVSKSLPYAPRLHTTFKVDEERFEISLHHMGHLDAISDYSFIRLLEEFSVLADEWRLRLDEHDKNDLVYVRVK